MHKSRLTGFVIDCNTPDLEGAARFWSAALGRELKDGQPDGRYAWLTSRSGELQMGVQRVDHPSRVHLDLETDDVEAEVARLEKLGARKIEKIKTWVVMEAPTGQRFCVCGSEKVEGPANEWR